ncbi:MAG: TolC family protein [Woeseia sp.]
MNNTNGALLLQAWLAAVLICLWTIPAGGSQAPGNEPTLTLEEAVQRTLDSHPALQVAALDVDVERARRNYRAQKPPIAFEAEVENVAGSGNASGVDGAEVTLRLSRVLERGRKPELRYDVGARRIDRALIAENATALALARDATDRFIEVVALQERVALAQRALRIATDTLEFVTASVEAGRRSRAEESMARVERARAELYMLDVERRLEAARLALASQWRASAPDFGRAEADFHRLPALPPYESLERRLENNPEIQRRATEFRLLQAQRRLAAAQEKSDISLAGGLKRLGETGDVGLVFSVSMPFGSAARARPLIEQSELQLARNPAAAEAQMLALRTLLSGLYNDLEFSRQASGRLRDDIIPEARKAVRMYEDAFRVGSSTLLELNQAQQAMLELQQELVDAAARYHATLMEIEYLLGAGYEVQP